jgi:hypothetical protein
VLERKVLRRKYGSQQWKQQGNWGNLYVRGFIGYSEILKSGWMGYADNLVWIHNRKFDIK